MRLFLDVFIAKRCDDKKAVENDVSALKCVCAILTSKSINLGGRRCVNGLALVMSPNRCNQIENN